MAEIRIEFPSVGATYTLEEYGVYQYDRYPEGDVLAHQERRRHLDSFRTLEEAQAKYPDAPLCGPGFDRETMLGLPSDLEDEESEPSEPCEEDLESVTGA